MLYQASPFRAPTLGSIGFAKAFVATIIVTTGTIVACERTDGAAFPKWHKGLVITLALGCRASDCRTIGLVGFVHTFGTAGSGLGHGKQSLGFAFEREVAIHRAAINGRWRIFTNGTTLAQRNRWLLSVFARGR